MSAARRRICVFCGSKTGNDPAYADAARALAFSLSQRGLGLVYGGAQRGLMGVLADAMLAHGGEVIGVIPRELTRLEVEHRGLTQLIEVGGMHERKAVMATHADAFIALPGGFGTLEELMEVITWSQLGIHSKPYGVLNAAGYFDKLVDFIDHMTREGFVRESDRRMLCVAADADELLQRMLP